MSVSRIVKGVRWLRFFLKRARHTFDRLSTQHCGSSYRSDTSSSQRAAVRLRMHRTAQSLPLTGPPCGLMYPSTRQLAASRQMECGRWRATRRRLVALWNARQPAYALAQQRVDAEAPVDDIVGQILDWLEDD